MQLNTPRGALRLGLMAASCTLLGTHAAAETGSGTASTGEQPWQFDTGLLYYKENGSRVQTIEPVVSVRKDYGDEHVLGLTFAFDSLSGGSPNGAIPTNKAQTFATPSGTSLKQASGVPVTYTTPSGQVVSQLAKITLYTINPGALPMDPNFHDQRIAGDASWSQPLGEASHVSVGGHLSRELDFRSAAANLAVSHDFNDKNTTLGLGINGEFDTVAPIGGAPLGGSDYKLLTKASNKSKDVTGGLLGVTQVLSRTWIAQLNVSYDRSHGYLTDPYKILSQVDATGLVTGYRFESRPDSRTRKAVYFGNKVAIGKRVLDISYRHGTDDWGIKSNTIDGHMRFNFGEDIYLEPHVRWYKQGAADFYHLYLSNAEPLPTYMSADPRLADFTAKTLGVKLGFLLMDQNELTFRLELYQQSPAQSSSSLLNLQGLDLNPGLKTVMLQVGWRHGY